MVRTRYFVETILGRPCDADGRTSLRGLQSRSCGRILSGIAHLYHSVNAYSGLKVTCQAYRKRTFVLRERTQSPLVVTSGLAE